MPESFHIDWTGLAPFEAGLRNAPKVIEDELGTAARTIADRGAELSRSHAPVWKGTARGGVYGKSEVSGSAVSAIFGSNAEDAWWADHGRGPGKMPPKGALIGWHGITEAEEFVVRRAIGLHGTKGTPFVSRAFKELSQGFAQSEFGKAIARALARIGGG